MGLEFVLIKIHSEISRLKCIKNWIGEWMETSHHGNHEVPPNTEALWLVVSCHGDSI